MGVALAVQFTSPLSEDPASREYGPVNQLFVLAKVYYRPPLRMA
jgi:hypothetical protein